MSGIIAKFVQASYATEEISLPLVIAEAGCVLRIDHHPAHRVFRLILTRIRIHRLHIVYKRQSLIEQDALSTAQRARGNSVSDDSFEASFNSGIRYVDDVFQSNLAYLRPCANPEGGRKHPSLCAGAA